MMQTFTSSDNHEEVNKDYHVPAPEAGPDPLVLSYAGSRPVCKGLVHTCRTSASWLGSKGSDWIYLPARSEKGTPNKRGDWC